MAEEDLSYEDIGRSFLIPQDAKTGFNPALTVLLVVLGIVLLFIIGNYALYVYAQRNLPPRKKKPVSKKKMKRERLRQGVAPPGE